MDTVSDFSSLSFRQKARKILFFAFIGHFLELYDYTLYVVLLTIISPHFFPSDSANVSLLFGMLSFGLSLLISPPAAWFWGWYGDRYGRLPMLRQSIMLMAFPSLIISLLPTYNEIGVLAPIVLVSCRFLQTISASGEVNGAKIFAMEHLGQKNLGRVSGLLAGGGGLGVLLAMSMGLLLSHTDLSWRIPFLLGASLAVVGVMIRRKVAESPEFLHLLKTKQAESTSFISTIEVIKNHKDEAVIVASLGALLGVLSYSMSAFFNPFIIGLGYGKNVAFEMGIIGLLTCSITSIITGVVVDKVFKVRDVMKLNIIACIVLMPCVILFLICSVRDLNILLYSAYMVQGVLLGMNATCCTVIMYQLFPPEVRCRGVMICYAVGIAIFGGFMPLILQLSTKLHHYIPVILVMAFATSVYLIYRSKIQKLDKQE